MAQQHWLHLQKSQPWFAAPKHSVTPVLRSPLPSSGLQGHPYDVKVTHINYTNNAAMTVRRKGDIEMAVHSHVLCCWFNTLQVLKENWSVAEIHKNQSLQLLLAISIRKEKETCSHMLHLVVCLVFLCFFVFLVCELEFKALFSVN